jgi:hypothetical protein
VVVLGYKFWQRHYGSDRSVLGKTIQMVRKNYTIVGVAAPRFTWDDADVYVPQKRLRRISSPLLCRRSPEAGHLPKPRLSLSSTH